MTTSEETAAPRHSQINRRSFSPEEIALRNNCGRTFIFGEIKAKCLPARKLGRLTRITLEDEAVWLQSRPLVGMAPRICAGCRGRVEMRYVEVGHHGDGEPGELALHDRLDSVIIQANTKSAAHVQAGAMRSGSCPGRGQFSGLFPLHGERGGPLRCPLCLGAWNASADGTLKRGKGFAATVEHLPRLADAIACARDRAVELGLLDDGGGSDA